MGPRNGSLCVKEPDLWQALLQVEGVLSLWLVGPGWAVLSFVGANICSCYRCSEQVSLQCVPMHMRMRSCCRPLLWVCSCRLLQISCSACVVVSGGGCRPDIGHAHRLCTLLPTDDRLALLCHVCCAMLLVRVFVLVMVNRGGIIAEAQTEVYSVGCYRHV